MMQGSGAMMPMMWGMGLLWLLVVLVLVLGAAALLKYLLSGLRRSAERWGHTGGPLVRRPDLEQGGADVTATRRGPADR
jgi:hypothetical protein